MASIRLDSVTLGFGEGPPALSEVGLRVADGELLVLAGPSGCGKTSLLRVIAGLAGPHAGRVWIGGDEVTGLRPARRQVSMVFQEYALLRDRTLAGNIGFPLEVRRVETSERDRRVREQARPLGILGVLGRRPARLGAGQLQAAATARALVREGRVLLMDEPLVHLDARGREAARLEVRRLHRETGLTIVYATNDPVEAMALGDRIAVMRRGTIVQVGEPSAVYRHPADTFVGTMLGSPPMRLVEGEVGSEHGSHHVDLGGQRLALDGVAGEWPGLAGRAGHRVLVGVRVDALAPARGGEPFLDCLRGEVVAVEHHGERTPVSYTHLTLPTICFKCRSRWSPYH